MPKRPLDVGHFTASTANKQMAEALARVEKAIDHMQWTRDKTAKNSAGREVEAYTAIGTANSPADGWTMVVMPYVSRGVEGVDGAATYFKEGLVIRFTQELARKALALARSNA